VVIEENVQYYDVEGDTMEHIRRDLHAKRPVDRFGERADGYTRWSLRWRVQAEPGCEDAAVIVILTLGTTLPRWTPPPFVDPLVIGRWNHFSRALMEHERGHRNAGVHAAIEVYELIARNLAEGRCQGADVGAEAIIEKYGQIDDEYDRHTDHGANEGVDLQ
jgi:predicted secreted Zn-dependent protease